MYDAQIGRWMSTDPMGEFWSPYTGMGNNPVSKVDPDGGQTKDNINFNTKTGKTEITKTNDNFNNYYIDGKFQGFAMKGLGGMSYENGVFKINGVFNFSVMLNEAIVKPKVETVDPRVGLFIGSFENTIFGEKHWFDFKQFKFYGRNFYGNGYTLPQKNIGKIANTMKWLGRGLAVKNYFDINEQYANGEISKTTRNLEQGSNIIGLAPGTIGLGWSIGWESGRWISQRPWYRENIRPHLQDLLHQRRD